MSVKVLLLNGSPRENGDTAHLLSQVRTKLEEWGATTDSMNVCSVLKTCDTPFCIHCSERCEGVCYDGTTLEKALSRLKVADAIVVGSPVYFGTVSGPLKAFWDFTRKLRGEKALLYTVGAAVTSGGGRFGGQETTLRAIFDIMLIHGMILVGDSSPLGMGHFGVSVQSPAASDPKANDSVERLARAVWDTTKATQSLRNAL